MPVLMMGFHGAEYSFSSVTLSFLRKHFLCAGGEQIIRFTRTGIGVGVLLVKESNQFFVLSCLDFVS